MLCREEEYIFYIFIIFLAYDNAGCKINSCWVEKNIVLSKKDV
jgi:hypothetical protein